jgi:signal transduction histidine kinase
VTTEDRSLDDQYLAALREYLAGAGEAPLKRAYELGRKAMADGRGVLEMLALHHGTLLSVVRHAEDTAECGRMIRAAEVFFAESLSPFEMAHRGYRETHAALRRLNETLEEEAKRIAHALHDEAGQLLVSVHLALDGLARDLPKARPRLQQVLDLLRQIEEELRRLSHELRPTILDALGLVPALEFLAQGVSARAGVSITVEGGLDRRLRAAAETALYRIVQEALTNATRHAHANRVQVTLGLRGGTVSCVVRDDGKGFDLAEVQARKNERGFGLVGIRERLSALGGTLEIHTASGRGTELLITIPQEAQNADPGSSCR